MYALLPPFSFDCLQCVKKEGKIH